MQRRAPSRPPPFKVYPDGTHALELRDGSYRLLDGSMLLPDGTIQFRDGTIQRPDGTYEGPGANSQDPAKACSRPPGPPRGPSRRLEDISSPSKTLKCGRG